MPAKRLLGWAGLAENKFYQWKTRYGKVNEHNAQVPRDWWLEDWEKRAILDFHRQHPLDGYRRLAFMMLDEDVVAVSPSSVYRVLREAGVMDRWNRKESKKGTGFHQPSGPQFIARDFKQFIRLAGMTHVRTSPYYPQSNGKLERFHRTLKGDCVRVKNPLSLEDARRHVADYVRHYNEERLHSAIGYVTPHDKLAGREQDIFAARDAKLEAARERRRQARQAVRDVATA